MTMFRGLNWLMAALFLLAVIVQFNDPDPARWVAIYGAAMAICLVVALKGRVHNVAPQVVMSVALVWGVGTMADVPDASTYTHMFEAWEMQSVSVEAAREAAGLLIVAAWMAVIVVAQLRRGK